MFGGFGGVLQVSKRLVKFGGLEEFTGVGKV